MIDLDTLWVCQCCMLTAANGECCSEEHGEMERPLRKADGEHWTLGMLREHHTCEPGSGECDCELNIFSTSKCDGCGSFLHGERHAMTFGEN